MSSAKSIDIAVIGAGPAASPRQSAGGFHRRNVLLIESAPRLGGSVTAAMHRALCGLYSQAPQSPLDTLNAGSQREVIAQMLELDPASVLPKPLGRTWVLEFPAAAYEAALLKGCDKPNIQRMMNTRVTNIRRKTTGITAIQIESQWIEIKTVIDCTGSGAVMQMAGEDTMQPPDSQRMLGDTRSA